MGLSGKVSYMTSDQKNRILYLRSRGNSLPEISDRLGISVNTIKSFLHRHHNDAPTESFTEEIVPNYSADSCKNCGAPIIHMEGKRERVFCSDKCRMRWWYRNRNNDYGESVYSFTCKYCGESFSVYGNKTRKYCSQDCFHKARKVGRNDE